MTAASALLAEARAAGVTVRLEPPDLIKVRGEPATVEAWARRLRQHKAAILALLSNLGGPPLAQAETVAELARAYYSHHWNCPACRAGTVTGAKLHRPCPDGARLWASYCRAAGREVAP